MNKYHVCRYQCMTYMTFLSEITNISQLNNKWIKLWIDGHPTEAQYVKLNVIKYNSLKPPKDITKILPFCWTYRGIKEKQCYLNEQEAKSINEWNRYWNHEVGVCPFGKRYGVCTKECSLLYDILTNPNEIYRNWKDINKIFKSVVPDDKRVTIAN